MTGSKRNRGPFLASSIFLLLFVAQVPAAGQDCAEITDDFQTRLQQGGQALAAFGGSEVAGMSQLLDELETMECDSSRARPAPGKPLVEKGGSFSVAFLVPCESSRIALLLHLRDSDDNCAVVRVDTKHEVDEVRPPIRVKTPRPSYTRKARKARIEGEVVIQATIDKKGNVTDAKIVKDLPHGLGERTLRAVKNWKFKPATLGGKPVAVYYNVSIRFSLP